MSETQLPAKKKRTRKTKSASLIDQAKALDLSNLIAHKKAVDEEVTKRREALRASLEMLEEGV